MFDVIKFNNIFILFDNIYSNIQKHESFSFEELEYFGSLFETIRIPKKTVYYKLGESNNCLSYINKGLIKGYIYDQDDKDIVLHFCKEDYWVSDVSSFYFQEPSRLQFETIEDTELLQITHDHIQKLFSKHPKFQAAFHNLLKRYIISFQERYINSQIKTALERYEIFEEKFPDLVQRVPQKSIASYLGVTPEFLSKLRRERK